MNGYNGQYGNPYSGETGSGYYGNVNGQWTSVHQFARLNAKENLKSMSRRAAYCIIAFVGLQYASVFLLGLLGFYPLYESNEIFKGVFDTLSYMLSVFVPFFILYLSMQRTEKNYCLRFDAPRRGSMFVPAIVIGLLFCRIGNFVTNYLVAIMEANGFQLSGGSYEAATTPETLFLAIINVAVLPALVEEFALRGLVMQPLRRYGDSFAIVMSSVMFSMMHGNLIQIPFALVVGLGIGYFTVATGSLWTGVIIHFINNLHSVIMNYLLEVRPTFAEKYYYLIDAIVIVSGIICLAVYFFTNKENRYRLKKNGLILSGGEKVSAYIFTVPMIILFIIMILQTVSLVDYVGG